MPTVGVKARDKYFLTQVEEPVQNLISLLILHIILNFSVTNQKRKEKKKEKKKAKNIIIKKKRSCFKIEKLFKTPLLQGEPNFLQKKQFLPGCPHVTCQRFPSLGWTFSYVKNLKNYPR